jgi:hypothetical protein
MNQLQISQEMSVGSARVRVDVFGTHPVDHMLENMNFLNYRLADVRILQNADGLGPYGVKGISEGGILAVSPAFSTAVTEATGLVIRDLPLTPQRVWETMGDAMKEAG